MAQDLWTKEVKVPLITGVTGVLTVVGIVLAGVSAIPSLHELADEFDVKHPSGGAVTNAEVCRTSKRGLLTVEFSVGDRTYTVRDVVTNRMSNAQLDAFLARYPKGQSWPVVRYSHDTPDRATLVGPNDGYAAAILLNNPPLRWLCAPDPGPPPRGTGNHTCSIRPV